MCGEASGDDPALPLLLIFTANCNFWLVTLPYWQEKPSQGLPCVTHCRIWAMTWELGGLTALLSQLSTLLLAYRQLDVSCPRAAEVSLTAKCLSLSHGSRAAAEGAARSAVPGLGQTDRRHQQPGSCRCPWIVDPANLLCAFKLSSQHRMNVGFLICFASLLSYYNTFLSFPLSQIICEQ